MKRFYILICVAGFALMGGEIFGQTKPPTEGSVTNAGVPRPEWVRMNIDFPGGSPELLIEQMEHRSGKLPNVIITPEAGDVMLPAFKLRDVSATQVFIALNTLGEPNFPHGYWQQAPIPDAEIWTLTMQRTPPAAIDPTTGLPIGSKTPTQRNCRVYNLTLAMTDYTVDDITTAMKGAWELLDLKMAPTMKFHPETKLLIVVGEDRQLGIANDVLRELTGNVTMKKREAVEKPQEKPAKKE